MHIVTDIIAILAANLVLSQALGTSTLFIAAGSRHNLLNTTIAITIFTTLGSAAAYFIDRLLTGDHADLRLFAYTLVIGIIYVLLLSASYFISREYFEKTRKYIHVSAFNCAVMGTIFNISLRAENDLRFMTFSAYLRTGLLAGLGFIVAALILAAAYNRLRSSKVPASFRGFPAMLVYLGIISMAVYALR